MTDLRWPNCPENGEAARPGNGGTAKDSRISLANCHERRRPIACLRRELPGRGSVTIYYSFSYTSTNIKRIIHPRWICEPTVRSQRQCTGDISTAVEVRNSTETASAPAAHPSTSIPALVIPDYTEIWYWTCS